MESCHQDREQILKELHQVIRLRKDSASVDTALWQAVIAYQEYPFFTSSGLAFSYVVKHNRSGASSGELIVSRKEDSKTLTKSSVMLAFHKVLDRIDIRGEDEQIVFVPAFYKGPKAIGQIFGISYIYSLFWEFGLIEIPEKVKDKMKGDSITV